MSPLSPEMGHQQWSLVTSCLTPAPALTVHSLCSRSRSNVQCQFELSCDKTNHLIFNVYKTSNNPNIRAAYLISVFTLGLNSLFECSGSLCHDLRYWSRPQDSSDSDTETEGTLRVSIFGFIAQGIHYDWRSNRQSKHKADNEDITPLWIICPFTFLM